MKLEFLQLRETERKLYIDQAAIQRNVSPSCSRRTSRFAGFWGFSCVLSSHSTSYSRVVHHYQRYLA